LCFNGDYSLKRERVMLWVLMALGLLIGGAVMYAGWRIIRNLD